MAPLKHIILTVMLFPLFVSAQPATTKKQYRYVVCSEYKKNWAPGHIDLNQRTGIADTTLCFVVGKIVDNKKAGIPFALVTLKDKNTGKTHSRSADLSGNYKITLIAGQYSYKTICHNYSPFTIDTVKLATGEIREININVGECFCIKTKILTSDKPIQDSLELIELSGKKQ